MWIAIIFGSIATVLSIPLMVIAIELFITFRNKRPMLQSNNAELNKAKYKILMPAHNEQGILAKTLSTLIGQGASPADIIVIADNCTDATAEIARHHSVTVLERFNDELRGKGFALDHGISYLKNKMAPDVLIVLDADCDIDSNSLSLLVDCCYKNNSPQQALYLMRKNTSDSLSRRIAGFAWLVKNKIRPVAVNKLGLPVTLTGTGMAFPWHVIKDVNIAHGNIVEDMQLGIDCTLSGFSPVLCQQAIVYSDFPERADAGNTQRTRWEHGHLTTIIQQVPRLLKQSILRKDWRLLGFALDVAVPPLSLLILLSGMGLLLLITYSYITNSYGALSLLLISVVFFSLMLVFTWWQYGRDYLTVKELCGIPIYVVSKISVYVTFIFKRQKSWIKTSRKTKD